MEITQSTSCALLDHRHRLEVADLLQLHFIRVCPIFDPLLFNLNRIILHDNTLNLPVVAQQPHPDPNHAPHAAARRVAT